MKDPQAFAAPDLPSLYQRFRQVRAASLAILAGLSDEDCCAQSMPDCSPLKWHLAHTTWFFETFVLEKFEAGFLPFDPSFRMLFNSYYNAVGAKHPRPQRGLLTRPGLAQVLAYRSQVEARILALPVDVPERELADLLELGMQHEQQHQELMQTDILHLFSCHPCFPARQPGSTRGQSGSASPLSWIKFDAQLCEIGWRAEDGFCFDNELPRHRQFIEAYQLAQRLVNNGEFLAFIQAGGYQQAEYWLAEGWDWVCREHIQHPLYWQLDADGVWTEFAADGRQSLQLHAPVLHLAYYEADAYARWAEARLPTEAEWEAAASSEQASQFADLFGCAWQWTSSSYAAYPGFLPQPGAVGEYNGKFMVNQYVLRGSSSATPPGHSRVSYRNFFPCYARWQFSGLRLARSLPAEEG